MRSLGALALLAAVWSAAACGAVAAEECTNPNALGVSRTLTIDPAAWPLIGTMSYHDSLPLADHEVVLTFDDGPIPPHTGAILDILALECVKATYFMVGEMANAHPEWVRKVAAAGHTIGTHSQTHPLTFHRMSLDKAQKQIDDGFASVQAALGTDYKVAPFFRYPGLLRQANSEAYLAEHHIMAWSADFPGDDWKRRITPVEVIRRSLHRLEARGRGILLLHDIHKVTVAALPTLLAELKARGFKVVHVVPPPDEPSAADLIASATPNDGVAPAIANPGQAASLTAAAAPAGLAKPAPEGAEPAHATAGAQPKTIAALPDAAAPAAETKAMSHRGLRERASRTHARAAARATQRPQARHVRYATRRAQPSLFQQTTSGARNNRACTNCRQIRVKKAHAGSQHSG
jgi:peptidoglycan/xylan/chitin deacetylase (PgdA/CDA1 family)